MFSRERMPSMTKKYDKKGVGNRIVKFGKGAVEAFKKLDAHMTKNLDAHSKHYWGLPEKPKAELDQKPEAKTEKSKNNSGNYPLNIDLRRTLYNEGSEGVSGELARLKQTRQEIQNQQEKVN